MQAGGTHPTRMLFLLQMDYEKAPQNIEIPTTFSKYSAFEGHFAHFLFGTKSEAS